MAGDLHTSDFFEGLGKLGRQGITPGKWFLSVCDGKFTDEDLNSGGKQFAAAYYANENGLYTGSGSYLAEYDQIFSSSATLYHVPDTWETQAIVSRFIGVRLARWRNGR